MKSYRLISALLIILAVSASPARGQEAKSRVAVGLGLLTAPDWMDIFSDVVLTSLSLGTYQTEKRSSIGALGLQYERFVRGPVALVGAGGFQRTTRDLFSNDDPRGKLTSTYAHLMGGAALHYHRGRTLGLYTNAAVGLALNHDSAEVEGEPHASDSRVRPAFQVTLLGIRAGGPIGAFMELGVGYRGTLVLGLSYDF